MEIIKKEFADVEGHDTTVKEIVKGFQDLEELERIERYELLADLYRDDAASEAAYVLLPNLVLLLDSLEGEVGLDVACIVGLIQVECLKLNVSDYRGFAMKVCGEVELKKVIQLISQWSNCCLNNDDLGEVKNIEKELSKFLI